MDVRIKGLDLDLPLKMKGVQIAVYDGRKHLGDLFINEANLIWCPGKSTPTRGGMPMEWDKFIRIWKTFQEE